jgi:hypothetical protein
MTRFAALLAYCLCCATITMASNPDQWTGTTTPEKVTVTQIVPKSSTVTSWTPPRAGDSRSNVMQAPKLKMFNSQSAGLRVQDKPTNPSTH